MGRQVRRHTSNWWWWGFSFGHWADDGVLIEMTQKTLYWVTDPFDNMTKPQTFTLKISSHIQQFGKWLPKVHRTFKSTQQSPKIQYPLRKRNPVEYRLYCIWIRKIPMTHVAVFFFFSNECNYPLSWILICMMLKWISNWQKVGKRQKEGELQKENPYLPARLPHVGMFSPLWFTEKLWNLRK